MFPQSTLSAADIYPMSQSVAPGASDSDVIEASGDAPAESFSNAPAISWLGMVIALVLLRLAWEAAE